MRKSLCTSLLAVVLTLSLMVFAQGTLEPGEPGEPGPDTPPLPSEGELPTPAPAPPTAPPQGQPGQPGQPGHPPQGAPPAYPYQPYPPYAYGPPPPPPPVPPPPTRNVSITLSPFHLLLPLLEVTGELRAHDAVGISLIGGYGQVTATNTYNIYELGGQLSFYPLEPFESLLLGMEVLWLKIDKDDFDDSIRASGEGVAVGPMAGYKYIAGGGFTLFVQLGAQYVTAKAKVTDGSSKNTAEDSAFIGLLNFNLGWSF